MGCYIRLTPELVQQQKKQNKEKLNLKTPEQLVIAHSFAIIGIYRTNTGRELLKLKNPWVRSCSAGH
jgi:hypothetical protein